MINNTDQENLFPKKISKLTAEQKLIKDDFMEHWLKVLRKNYTILDRFNHKVVVNNKPKNFLKTLEIGAGLGEHLNLPYEIFNELEKKFIIKKKIYFPFPVSFEFCNLVIGINLILNPKN